MEKLAQYLVNEKRLKRIACFYQNDGYGQAGLQGLKNALKRRSLELTGTGNYERNSIAVKGALLSIRDAEPEAVVMVGAYKPCAEFIRTAQRVGMSDLLFCNISFVGSEALRNELGEKGEGCIISQVVSYPWDQDVPLVKRYTEAMKRYQPEAKIGFVSLEGYMVGRLFCLVAGSVEGPLTRQAFLRTISQKKSFDLGGIELVYGPRDHQGMDKVFLTVISGGKIRKL
jgi:ABC-type branched-subunit amino acid transport system substrate-binding protein